MQICGECTYCGEKICARDSKNRDARTGFLNKIRDHWTKRHPKAFSRRIKAGKTASVSNPNVQDFVSALQSVPERAVQIYADFTEAQYQYIKTMMDALEPVLPIEVKTSWKIIEAVHDSTKS